MIFLKLGIFFAQIYAVVANVGDCFKKEFFRLFSNI